LPEFVLKIIGLGCIFIKSLLPEVMLESYQRHYSMIGIFILYQL
jgi:hypothetical protein